MFFSFLLVLFDIPAFFFYILLFFCFSFVLSHFVPFPFIALRVFFCYADILLLFELAAYPPFISSCFLFSNIILLSVSPHFLDPVPRIHPRQHFPSGWICYELSRFSTFLCSSVVNRCQCCSSPLITIAIVTNTS